MTSTSDDDRGDADPITCIITDVDGVMTDGRIIYDDTGREIKHFHVRDGLGIKLWMRAGFQFGILTSRTSPIVQNRATELGIEHVKQGAANKLPVIETMLGDMNCDPSSVCYIGDDLPDIPVMQHVALSVAPADAASDVVRAANWVLGNSGGQGVLRELIERLLRSKQRWEELLPS
jgi:3-deoxy-D-manno-octulosonate 8-phosphate phosphatase (KDO 8-P phosphatase)